jgi:uncharacterized membrane protein YhaH (DUF805 family)
MDQQTTQTSPSLQSQPQTSVPPVAQNQNAENYFGKLFSGRINRRNYFVGGLILAAFEGINELINFGSLKQSFIANAPAHANPQMTYLVTIPIAIIIVFFGISLSIRRLHDLNKTGWLTLIIYIPLVGAFYGLYLLFSQGTTGENKYGSQPLPRVNLNQDILRLS